MKLFLENPPAFLKMSEVAQALQMHPKTIARWCRDGSIPCVRWGGRRAVRIPLSELQRLEKVCQQ
jgi:excisionase family DNA binding protein